jgi:PAS domain S-box-containing protein
VGSPVRQRVAPRAERFKRDLIQQTAYPMLVFRLLDGLAVWVLFNQAFLPDFSLPWAVHGLLFSYFTANSFFCLRYRARRITDALVLADLVTNLGTMTLLSAWTGGISSSVVLVLLIKIAGYGVVYGPYVGTEAIVTLLLLAGTITAGSFAGWWSVASPDSLAATPPYRLDMVFRLSVLGAILGGAVWVFRQVEEKEARANADARRAKGAAQREHASGIVTSALLAMSEATSRLTRLDDILNKVVDIAPRILEVDYCGIFLWNEETGTYRGAAAAGVEPALVRRLTSLQLSPAEVPDLEWVRTLGHCAVIAPRGMARMGLPDTPTLLTAPLLSGGRFYGVVQFARRSSQNSFIQRDLTIADGIAGQTAVALERARLVEESRRLVRAVESAAEAILITDRHRRIVFANETFLQLFGYQRDDILGQDALVLNDDLSDEQLQEIQQHVADSNWRGEALARRQDGSRFPVAFNTSLIRTTEGRIQGAVVLMQDVSAQRALEEQLHRADRLAAAGELAAGVAHEVNNALVGILGQTELARGPADAGALRSALATVETQGRRIADIVQGLLGFARPQPPQRGAVDLHDLVRDTLQLMAHDLGRSGIRSETRIAAAVPPVLADAKQIQQVLVNLFANAAQAMEPHGGGTLAVDVDAGPGVVCVEVRDTGIGIAAEDLPRVFDPFFSTKSQGNGLGLSVSYAIVQAHGGEMTVRSTPGAGTTFAIRLPAAVPLGPPVAERMVLLVDDDAAVADTLISMLTHEGLAVRRVATGQEALAALRTTSFDAIFLDVRLPDISGQEVYARLAAEKPDLARRVIFVTGGLWRVESRGLREKLPPQPTLSKPCTLAQIREALRLLRDTRAAA